MKRLFAIVAVVCTALVFADAGVIPPADWEPSGFQFNMTLYAQVLREDGTLVEQDESLLAAFGADGECRGVIAPIDGPNGRLFQMYIASNSLTEAGLALKVLDALTGEVHDIMEAIDFTSDAVVPGDGIVNPMALHVVPEPPTITLPLAPGWNLVSIPFTPTAKDAQTLLAMMPMAFAGGAYVRAKSIKANIGYWLFEKNGKTLKLERTEAVEAVAPPKGWSLAGGKWPADAMAFGWKSMHFFKAEKSEEGKAFWIFSAK